VEKRGAKAATERIAAGKEKEEKEKRRITCVVPKRKEAENFRLFLYAYPAFSMRIV
jgi:hypothetical protein